MTSSEERRVKVEGPAELIAAGNANPELDGSIRDDRFKLFRGRGLVVVRSTGASGNIIVSVGGEVTPEEIITIVAE